MKSLNQIADLLTQHKIPYTLLKNPNQIVLEVFEDQKPYHGKILHAYLDRLHGDWTVHLKKTKIKYLSKYTSSYITRLKTRQQAVDFINEFENL